MLQWQAVNWDRVWRTSTLTPLHLINLKQTTTDTFNSMLYVDVHAAGVKAHSRNGLLAPVWCARPLLQRLWWSFFLSSYIRFGTGHFQLVSSTTGHTKLINFPRTTPLPNGAAALRGPVHNVVMTRRSKVVWPVPQLRRKIAIARCIVFVWGRGPAVTSLYIDIWGENFRPKMIQNASKTANVVCCTYWILFELSVQWYFKYKYSTYSSWALKCNFSLH